MNKWLATPNGTEESAEAYAVLEKLENQVGALASIIAFAWRQECL